MAWKLKGKIAGFFPNAGGQAQQDVYRVAFGDSAGTMHEIEKAYFLSPSDIAYFNTLTDQEKLDELATGNYDVWHRYWDPTYRFVNCYTYQDQTLPAFLYTADKSFELKTITVYTRYQCDTKSHLTVARYDGDDITNLDYGQFYVIANNDDFVIASSTLCDFKTEYNEDVYETVIQYVGQTPLSISCGTSYMMVVRMRESNQNNYDLVYDTELTASEPVARSLNYDNYSIHDTKNSYWRSAANATTAAGYVKYGISGDDLQWANDNEPFSAMNVIWNAPYDDVSKVLKWQSVCDYPVGSNNPINIDYDVQFYQLDGIDQRIFKTSADITDYSYFADEGMHFVSVMAYNEDKSPTAKGGWCFPYDEPDDTVNSSCIDTYQYSRLSASQAATFLTYTPQNDCKLSAFSFFSNEAIASPQSIHNLAVIELDTTAMSGQAYASLTEDHRTEYKFTNINTIYNGTSVSSENMMLYKHYMKPSSEVRLSAGKTYAFALFIDLYNDTHRKQAFFRTNASSVNHYPVLGGNPYYLGQNSFVQTNYNAYALITTAAV